MNIRWPNLPTTSEKPSWASLFGVAGAAYIFIDPYRQGASGIEWLITALTFAAFLILTLVAAVYWAERRIMRPVCAAMAACALAFTAYRPSGACLYVFIAAYGAVATGGAIGSSAAITVAATLTMLVQWHLRWPHVSAGWFPYIVALESLLMGGAITFAMRQQTGLRRALKTAEQERIARDLHDILGHTLSVVILKSELANRLIEQDLERAKCEMRDVEQIARKALSEVREAICGYRSVDMLTELEHAQQTLMTAGIAVQRDLDAITLPVAHERVLALVLRETITNVLRHSRATQCKLMMKRTPDSYELIVADNGCGVSTGEGNGMRGIRERLATIGGEATWRSAPGTEVRIRVPMASTQLRP